MPLINVREHIGMYLILVRAGCDDLVKGGASTPKIFARLRKIRLKTVAGVLIEDCRASCYEALTRNLSKCVLNLSVITSLNSSS
jgi:hypothetical protein